jgi:hypothetical protein
MSIRGSLLTPICRTLDPLSTIGVILRGVFSYLDLLRSAISQRSRKWPSNQGILGVRFWTILFRLDARLQAFRHLIQTTIRVLLEFLGLALRTCRFPEGCGA